MTTIAPGCEYAGKIKMKKHEPETHDTKGQLPVEFTLFCHVDNHKKRPHTVMLNRTIYSEGFVVLIHSRRTDKVATFFEPPTDRFVGQDKQTGLTVNEYSKWYLVRDVK